MKQIFLLRHAQAASAAASDFERTLTPNGLSDAKALGEYMRSKNYVPEVVLCSSAVRTQQTCEQLGLDTKPEFMKAIYNASRGELFSLLQDVSDEYKSAMIIGHNPTIYELVGLMASSGTDSVMGRLAQGYAPASLSVIEAPADEWAQLHPDENTLIDLVNPLDYNAPERPTRWM